MITQSHTARLRTILVILAAGAVSLLWFVDARFDSFLMRGPTEERVFGVTLERARAESIYRATERPLLIASGVLCLVAAASIFKSRRNLTDPVAWFFAGPVIVVAGLALFRPNVPPLVGETLLWLLPLTVILASSFEAYRSWASRPPRSLAGAA